MSLKKYKSSYLMKFLVNHMYKIQNNIPYLFCLDNIKKIIDWIPVFSPIS